MRIEEFEAVFNRIPWSNMRPGNFNEVKVTDHTYLINGVTARWVFRKAIIIADDPIDNALCDRHRIFDKWKMHHPKYPIYELQEGLLVPYFGEDVPEDRALAKAVLDIYRKTRNIAADACSNNFRWVHGELICFDFDEFFRRGSPATDAYYAEEESEAFLEEYLIECAPKYPETIRMIRMLFYLEKCLPAEEILNEYLTPAMIDNLAVFSASNIKIRVDTILFLLNGGTIENALRMRPVCFQENDRHLFFRSLAPTQSDSPIYISDASETSTPCLRRSRSDPSIPMIISRATSQDSLDGVNISLHRSGSTGWG